jgi:acyl carrier protein
MGAVSDDPLNRVLAIVRSTGNLAEINPNEDFYDAGFSSINALQLLLELEGAFDVTIPDDEFVAARTCTDLHELVTRLSQ